MLSESFVASILAPEKPPNSSIAKDAGIHIYEYQPLSALKSSFKRSSTKANCLTVSPSHIFAAQADKAVVHVYSRERGNQETIVPFPEKICSLALVGTSNAPGILALGTEGGRIVLWELCTGRQVSTAQSHLQATTCLTVDSTSNFLLSGSPDSNVHIWSLPTLLSFSSSTSNDPSQPSPLSPIRTLSNHRAEITALITGRSSSSTGIAISASIDNTCIVWEYRTGTLLHTYLLPATPLCLTLDPADRAFYAGYEDGSIQLISFYTSSSLTNLVHDPARQATPTQPPPSSRRYHPSLSSQTLSLALSYTGTTLLSGHQNGAILTWDVANERLSTQLADFSSSITNIHMLPPVGFPNSPSPILKINQVVKPRYESSLASGVGFQNINDGPIPQSYNFIAQFCSPLPLPRSPNLTHSFSTALAHPSFPPSLLEEGLLAFSALAQPLSTATSSSIAAEDHAPSPALELEVATLRTQLAYAKSSQQAYTEKALELHERILWYEEKDRERGERKRRRRMRKEKEGEKKRKEVMERIAAGKGDVDVEMGKGEDEEEEEEEEEEFEGSTTDELSESE